MLPWRRKIGEPGCVKVVQRRRCDPPKSEDINPDQWLDEGELMELPEIPGTEAAKRVGKEAVDLGTPEADT